MIDKISFKIHSLVFVTDLNFIRYLQIKMFMYDRHNLKKHADHF